jgi:hypothetical protein
LALGPLNSYASRKQTCVAYDKCFSGIKHRKQLAKTAQAVREQTSNHGLIITIRQSHRNQVVALAQDSPIHLRRSLAYYDKTNAVFAAFFQIGRAHV